MLTTPQRSAHLGVQSQLLNTMVGPQFLNTMVGPQLLNTMVGPQFLNTMVRTQLSAYMVQSQLPTDSFSKSSNSQDHRFQAWRHPHSSLITYLEFIMTIVIVISFAHERKTVPNVCVPELRAE